MKTLATIIARARRYKLNLDDLYRECRRVLMFLERKKAEEYLNPHKLAEQFALCQHYLDRLTDRKVQIVQNLSHLEALEAEAERHLFQLYQKKLEKVRVTDQKNFIATQVAPITRNIKVHRRALDILDVFINNLSQTHWTLSKLQGCLDLLIRLER